MRTEHLVLATLLLSCHRAGAPAASAPSAETAVRNDLSMLCARVEARSVSAWSQPAYQSREVGDLALAIDQGDDAARCKLGTLMREHRIAECRGLAKGLRQRCAP